MFRILSLLIISAALAAPAGAEDAPAPSSTECTAMQSGECPADCPHHGAHAGPEGLDMFERMDAELALSDSQKQQLGALLEMYRPRIMELWKRGEGSADALFDLAPDAPEYATRAAELSQLAGTSAAEMVTLMTELQSNAYALLNADQQKTFMAMRAEQRARMEARKAEMQAKKEAGTLDTGHHHHRCKACAWLEADDAAAAGAD